jgi:hypothetical protein
MDDVLKDHITALKADRDRAQAALALVAVLQLVRAVGNWPVTIGATNVPVWVS